MALLIEDTATADTRRILVIHSLSRELAPFRAVTSTFRTELAQRSPEPLSFYETSLDGLRQEDAAKESALVDYLQALLRQQEPDLIMTDAEPASMFLARHRAKLFPNTPALVVVNQRMVSAFSAVTNAIVVPVQVELSTIMDNILQVLPATTNVVMVLGSSPIERYWTAQCQTEFAPFTNRVAVRYLNDLSLNEICAEVANLPPDSAVLYGMLAVDAAGVPYEQERALARIYAAANAPLFGVLEHHLGSGIIGGRLVSMEAVGREAARVGLAALQRLNPTEVRSTGPGDPIFDWRELQRWGLGKKPLPPGSEVRFRQPSQWEEHRSKIIGAVALCLLQTLLIVALLVQKRRGRLAEETLRQSEERLSLATAAAKVGVWSWDLERGTIQATPECKQIFGVPPEQEVNFETFEARVHPEDRLPVRQALDEAIQSRTIYNKEYRIVCPESQTRWISARGRGRYQGGKAVEMLGVLVDVTEQRTAEQEAAQHRAELAHLSRVNTVGELSGSLAHELNQPLGIILSNAQAARNLLVQNPPDIDEVREILEDIVAADRRAGEVIQRMRALLKRGDTSMQPVSLSETAEEVLSLANAELIGRGVIVIRNLDANLPRVNGDRVQLQQLLLNLIINAADAMVRNTPDLRRLYVDTCVRGGGARVSIADEGIGLPPEVDRLFEPFFTTKASGLGLGLAICRSIAQAHGGKLWAEPRAQGGAVFHLELPILGL